MAGHGPDERSLDPGIRVVLGELRDLRSEMRADRRRADADRRRADEERRQERIESDERFVATMREWKEGIARITRESDERYAKAMRESEERSAKTARESEERHARIVRDTQRAWRDLRTVGLSIVKTLNHHTRILERIERRLSEPGRWRPGHGNGRGGQRER